MATERQKKNEYDVLVIGAGPGGLSAAAAAMEQGAALRASHKVAVLERDDIPGGILNQCVHDGFGIVRCGAQLSGPEYAQMEWERAKASGAEILTGRMVTEISRREQGWFQVISISRQGREELLARSVVLATGCRERTRGMLSIPGTRPAGIYTAGTAQNLINRRNIMVGRKVVILGSGDIGLIMARRLSLEGATVLCVAEALPEPSGLARNVRQCLFDFDIPLYLNTTVTDIFGKGRLEAVELSRGGERFRVLCDTLILSVGLVPENEVAQTAGVALDPVTNGAITDEYLQTGIAGIFACGNARAVMDLADFVSMQGEVAGANAAICAASPAGTIPLRRWKQDLHNAARKGLPEEGSVTCTLCPKGCQVRLVTDGKESLLTGNGCPRGEAFARQELTDPHRILTTTIRVRYGDRDASRGSADSRSDGGILLPVRSDRPVPLHEMRDLVRQLQTRVILLPSDGIHRADVLIRGMGSESANIIAETDLA